MNIKTVAVGFGVVMLLVGLLGYVSALTPDGKLLGLFQVDGLHNLVHILTGVAALAAGMTSDRNSRLYFQVFGVVYALVTVLGLITGNGLAVLLPVNGADNVLHLLIAALALYMGFGVRDTARA